jgi:hypothetical protein
MGASVVAARGADLTRGIPTKRLFSEAATRYFPRGQICSIVGPARPF